MTIEIRLSPEATARVHMDRAASLQLATAAVMITVQLHEEVAIVDARGAVLRRTVRPRAPG